MSLPFLLLRSKTKSVDVHYANLVMRSLLVFLAGFAEAAYGQSAYKQCGSELADPASLEVSKKLRNTQRVESSDLGSQSTHLRTDGLLIPTYLHVIESQDKAGFVTDGMLDAQV
jgi:hypothetical protein